MRALIGVGTPFGLQGRVAALLTTLMTWILTRGIVRPARGRWCAHRPRQRRHLPRQMPAVRTEVVGTTRTALDRYAMFESTMDNLLLDAIANAADRPMALSNGWRYGAPIPPGPLTELDLWNIVPANPPVSVVAISGEELRRLFEENLEATFACDPWQQRGGYLKRCRGIQLAVKLENPKGHRIQEFRVDGDRLRRDAIYSVAFLGEQARAHRLRT